MAFIFICQKCDGEFTLGDDGYYCELCGNFVEYRDEPEATDNSK